MAVAHDAATESHTGTTGSANQASFSFSHTPVGTPAGVAVMIVCNGATAVTISSVIYGGSGLTYVPDSTAADTVDEPGTSQVWFLGSSVPTGAQTVVVNRTNNATTVYAVAVTVTAAANTGVTGVLIVQESGALIEGSIDDGSPGTNSVRYGVAHYGGATPPIAGTNSTLLAAIDYGASGAGAARETTAGQGARLVGLSASTDDRAYTLFAIREVAGGPVTSPPRPTVVNFAVTRAATY